MRSSVLKIYRESYGKSGFDYNLMAYSSNSFQITRGTEITTYMRAGTIFVSFQVFTKNLCRDGRKQEKTASDEESSLEKCSQNSVHLVTRHTHSFKATTGIRQGLPLSGLTIRVSSWVTKEMNRLA